MSIKTPEMSWRLPLNLNNPEAEMQQTLIQDTSETTVTMTERPENTVLALNAGDRMEEKEPRSP